MNNKRSVDVVAISLIAVLVIGFVYWLVSINPAKEQINATSKTVEPIDKDLLRSKEVGDILTRTNNGNLPFKINFDQKPKDNPFSNLE